MESDQLD